MSIIYHLTTRQAFQAASAWAEAGAGGEYEAPSLAAEGFIHCSNDVPQMLRVAARLYPGSADLLALELNVEKLKAPVKFEPSRSGEVYPHIYGKLNLDAVERVRTLILDANGRHSLEE